MTFLPWPVSAAALALMFGATFQRPAKPVPVLVIQATYEMYLIAGATAAAAFACGRGQGGFRALLAGSGGAPRTGWIALGTASAWLAIAGLGTVLPAGDAKARDLATHVHGWAAVDGWLLIICALGPLAEELLWRRAIFTALAGVAARRVGERPAVVFAIALSSLMFAGWHLLGGDSPATLWERTLLGIVLCTVFGAPAPCSRPSSYTACTTWGQSGPSPSVRPGYGSHSTGRWTSPRR